MLKQGQEVRDAADHNRIGIVVGTGSSLGARVLWCWDESLTWTSERPVVLPKRTPDDARFRPIEGDKKKFSDRREFEIVSAEGDQVYLVDNSNKCGSWLDLRAWSSVPEFVPAFVPDWIYGKQD